MPLPQMPFGLRLPGTDGFSLPQGGVPGGPMPAPLPDGMGQEAEAFSFQPPPVLPSPPVPAPEGQQTSSTQAGSAQPSPVGNSDKKGGLSTWLPLILGTLGAGAWAAKEKSFTDFGVNLLQGAVDQTFTQQEEKRKRQFELDTADLKQGQEVIKDLMAIDEGSLDGLENEIRNNPAFSHLAAYIGPLREAKQKYRDVTATGSDGGMKITAKEAASLAHYYNAVKGAKEFINKFNEQKQTTGFAGQKAGAEEAARRKAIEEAYLAAGGTDPSKLYRIYGPNARDLPPTKVRDDVRLAQWFANEMGNPDWESVHGSPLEMKKAELHWIKKSSAERAGAGAEARLPFSQELKLTPPPVMGADGQWYEAKPGTVVPRPFDAGMLEKARANNDLLKGLVRIKQLAASDAVKKELGNAFGANWANLSWQKLQDRAAELSPETKEFITEVGLLTSDKIKEKYGTAFSAGEQTQASTWISKPADSIAKIMTTMGAFERHAYNTLESVQESNPTWPGHTTFNSLKERNEARKADYEAFAAAARAKGSTPPPFKKWLEIVGR